MEEIPALGLAYLQVIADNAFGSRTVHDCDLSLRRTLDILETLDALPVDLKPAQTLRTAQRRFGLDVDEYIEC